MFWPTGVPVTATSTARPRQAQPASSVQVPNRRFDLTNDLVELSLLMYYGETEPYLSLLRDVGREGGRIVHPEPETSDYLQGIRKNKERLVTPLDVLTSKLRDPEIVDIWTPYEVALFEASLCKFGEQGIAEIARHIPSKSEEEVRVFFGQVYSKTKRYQVFKDARQFKTQLD